MAPTKKAATITTEADAPAAKVTKKNASSKSNDDDSAAKKHNGPPKGALNAYSCFIRENREAIHADEKHKNFMKSAAAAWKAVEDKSEYEQMAKEDKERYEREIASYTPGK
uniref:HMG box domain-containing protein n=1 Tax=Panagrolaimus sp. PS1159 TaxID=55785 RepID=A0AC35GJB8_9BILA